MTDRDRRRESDPLHGDALSQTWDDEDRTPVGKPSRRRVPDAVETSGEIDTDAIRRETQPDARWEAFAEIQREVEACKQDRLKRERRNRWLMGLLIPSGGAMLTLLVWALKSLDARASANAEEMQRRREHQQLLLDVRELQDASIRHDERLRLLRVNPFRSDRPDPRTDRGDP